MKGQKMLPKVILRLATGANGSYGYMRRLCFMIAVKRRCRCCLQASKKLVLNSIKGPSQHLYDRAIHARTDFKKGKGD